MKNIYIITFLLVAFVMNAAAQSKTQYFQPSYSQRHNLNPAFSPYRGYVAIPGLGKIDVMLRSNLGLSNFLFPLDNGELGTFMHPEVSYDQFLNTLSPNNYMNMGLQMSLLSAGWYYKESFWSIDLDLDVNTGYNLPYDLFEFAKRGMTHNPTEYDMSNIQANAEAITSLSIGYSRQIDKNLRVGAKVKFLASLGAIDMNVSQMNLQLSDEAWRVDAMGNVNMMGTFFTIEKDAEGNFTGIKVSEFTDIAPAGYGGAIDLGAEYDMSDLVKGLKVSLAVVDLGFIRYSAKNVNRGEAQGSVNYSGFDNVSEGEDFEKVVNQLENELLDMLDFKMADPISMTYGIRTTINAGVEYAFLENKMSVGLLSSTVFGRPKTITEVTASYNLRPVNWFSANMSYSFANTFQTIGASLNFTPKWFLNLFLACDYIALNTNPQYIPLKDAFFNFQMGIVIPLANNIKGGTKAAKRK